MAGLCLPVTWRLVSRDGSRWCEFRAGDWEAESLRSVIPEGHVDASTCKAFDSFEPWCDHLEMSIGGELAMRYVYTGGDPDGAGTIRLNGEGQATRTNFRRWPQDVRLINSSGDAWNTAWATANSIEPTGLVPEVVQGGDSFELADDEGALISGMLGTLGTYITWSEHGGALYDWIVGEEPTGRDLERLVITGCDDTPQTDSSAIVNDLVVAYTEALDVTVRWPPEGTPNQAGCLLQSPYIELPGIPDQATAQRVVQELQEELQWPAPVFTDVEIDVAKVDWDDLIPGVWHTYNGERFNLESVVLAGTAGCVETATASYDQSLSNIRQQLR